MQPADSTNLDPIATPIRFLRLPDVKAITGMGRTKIYGLPDFPRPIKLTDRASGWIEAEVQQWCADRIAASREKAA
jgi:prophage regulatory protein